jgi:D-alanyl-D-alanine carboxypeptidase
MLASGNDAATALSYIYSGDPDDFVELMNKKAYELGLADTHFDNPSGLDGETHFSTARDMAILAAYAMENEMFASVVSCRNINIGERYLKNHNKLLDIFDGTIGIKTGFTKACGRCLVSSVRRNGRTFIFVTLNAPDDWNDHMQIYEQAFDGITKMEIVTAGKTGSAAVVSGEKNEVGLYINEGFSISLRPEEKTHIRLSMMGARFCYAPVKAGEVYGELRIFYKDRMIFRTPVYYADNVNASVKEEHSFWEAVRNMFKRGSS